MSRHDHDRSFGDPQTPQGLILVAVLVGVLILGVYLIVAGLT